jgi:hypothetical protein
LAAACDSTMSTKSKYTMVEHGLRLHVVTSLCHFPCVFLACPLPYAMQCTVHTAMMRLAGSVKCSTRDVLGNTCYHRSGLGRFSRTSRKGSWPPGVKSPAACVRYFQICCVKYSRVPNVDGTCNPVEPVHQLGESRAVHLETGWDPIALAE